ncbi:MAG: CBS domain-containing protein [archaeon]
MESRIKVGDVMTRNFAAVSSDTNLIDCARLMMKKRVGSLIVKDKQRLQGIITEKDIIWALTKKSQIDLKNIKVKDIAARKVATIKPSADIFQAIKRMKKLKFRRLPVVVNRNVIGMLTLNDIIRIEPSLFDISHSGFNIKEESDKLRRKAQDGGRWIREGMCEECGNYNLLYKLDGRVICSSCKDSM